MTSPETMIALAKSVAKQIDGLSLPVGTHKIDATVLCHLHGTVKKSPDSEYTPTVKVPWLTAMALLLERAGVTRAASIGLLGDVIGEAIRTGENAQGAVADRLRDIEAAMESVRQVTDSLPKQVRAGQTRVDVELTVEMFDAVSQQSAA